MADSLRVPLVLLVGVLLGCSAVTGEQSTSGPRSVVGPVEDRVISLTAFIPAPAAKAYSYFASAKLLESWLTAAAEVEPRIGGKYELFWEPDDRENNSTIGCRITALAPNQYLAFQWRSPKQFKAFANAADPLTHVVVMFVPEESGTRVHVVHSGWRSSSEWEEARIWQERAWSAAIQRLERLAAR